VEQYLRDARLPLRLACNGGDGHPVLASLWFAPEGDELWCATQRASALARHLERDGRCAFEVSGETPPYRGVRGQATARLDPARGESVLNALIDRYGQQESHLRELLMSRIESEVAIAIRPRSLVSWDFSRRMRPIRESPQRRNSR